MTGYVWHVGTLVDGLITGTLPLVSTSWSVVMDDAGPLSGTLPLADPAVAALQPYLTAEPCRCFLAVAYTDPTGTETFLAGGPIWTHSYDGPSRQLTIGAAGLHSLWDHRKVLPVLLAGQSAAVVTTTLTASLGTIAKRLVQLAQSHLNGTVPVVLPADEAGTNTRTYAGFDLNIVGSVLRDLTAVDGGPEIRFTPRRQAADARKIEWLMQTGTTAAPLLTQAGADWIWDASVPKSSVQSISVQRDGSIMGTRAWVKGAGTDTKTLISEADSTALTDEGFPLLEVEVSGHEQVTNPATTMGYATGLLARSQKPAETWNAVVERDRTPNVAQSSVGDWASFTITDDPYIPPGTYRMRILSKGGDDGRFVPMQLGRDLGGV